MTSSARALILLAALVPLGCGGGGTVTMTGGGGDGGMSSSSGTGGASSSSSASSSGSGGASSSSSSSSSSSGAVPMPKGCLTDVSAGHHVFPCAGGLTYDVDVPPACAAGGCGLVLDMHGYTMNADSENAGTDMRAHGQQHGYVVVQPTAQLLTGWVQATDAPSVFAFVADAAAALATDPKRAHVLGFSQGGGMTWRMICDHADFFASAAPLSALTGCEWSPPLAPTREVPTLQVHGHKDSVLAFSVYGIPERDAALAFWKDGAGAVIETDAGHTATRYLSPSGTPFEFWEHDYAAPNALFGGHCFPGGTDVGPGLTQFGCADANTFAVGAVAMAFFVAHPMP
jgi:hypothetical protein